MAAYLYSLILLAPGPFAGDGFPLIDRPDGFVIEKVASGLTYPTAVAWDDVGLMYVAEAGGHFLEESAAPARILLVQSDGTSAPILDLPASVQAPIGGLVWSNGAFYFTHRNAADRSGAVSRITLDGQYTLLITGIIDSQSEHPLSDIRVGPDGRLYFAAGPATNSGVVGIDIAPFVTQSPGVHAVPCEDIVLTGVNFLTPDFRTDDQSDTVLTGAFVPFGEKTMPGQLIQGSSLCGGAIHSFDPIDPAGTLDTVAWGLRNVIGVAWDTQGNLVAAVNGYDIRGSRPINEHVDATYRIFRGAWYGYPDFSMALKPVTDPKFDSPNSQQAPVFHGDQPAEKALEFVIDHAASGLSDPSDTLVLTSHAVNSSPSKLDVAPASWGSLAGHIFIAEWGDLTPITNPLGERFPGYQVVQVAATGGKNEIFLQNVFPGPASGAGNPGLALERPFDVRFGPDDALYVVDFGVARVNPARVADGQVPYEFPPATGVIWRITPSGL